MSCFFSIVPTAPDVKPGLLSALIYLYANKMSIPRKLKRTLLSPELLRGWAPLYCLTSLLCPEGWDFTFPRGSGLCNGQGQQVTSLFSFTRTLRGSRCEQVEGRWQWCSTFLLLGGPDLETQAQGPGRSTSIYWGESGAPRTISHPNDGCHLC